MARKKYLVTLEASLQEESPSLIARLREVIPLIEAKPLPRDRYRIQEKVFALSCFGYA